MASPAALTPPPLALYFYTPKRGVFRGMCPHPIISGDLAFPDVPAIKAMCPHPIISGDLAFPDVPAIEAMCPHPAVSGILAFPDVPASRAMCPHPTVSGDLASPCLMHCPRTPQLLSYLEGPASRLGGSGG